MHMATHSRILAGRTPWTEEPGRLQSTGSHRIGHDGNDLECMHTTFLVLIYLITLSLYILTLFIRFSLLLLLASGNHKSDPLWRKL